MITTKYFEFMGINYCTIRLPSNKHAHNLFSKPILASLLPETYSAPYVDPTEEVFARGAKIETPVQLASSDYGLLKFKK